LASTSQERDLVSEPRDQRAGVDDLDEGGRFLLVGPGYDGPLPDGGYHVGHSRTALR
jgi:hypothetical protein